MPHAVLRQFAFDLDAGDVGEEGFQGNNTVGQPFVDLDSVFNPEVSGAHTFQGLQVSAAVQQLPQVVRQAADVGPAGTDDAEAHQWWLEARDFENGHLDRDGSRFQAQPAACELVGGNASNFFRGDEG